MTYPPMEVIEPNLNIQWSVTPLFCKPICIAYVDNILENDLKDILTKTDWISDTENTGSNGAYSNNRNVLDNHINIKQNLEVICNSAINGVLGYGTNLKITTSWFTKTELGGSCLEHIHCNSWYSGVLYFDDYDTNSAPLTFIKDFPAIFVNPSNPNFLNSSSLTIKPESGMIILFPSEVRHKVLNHSSSISRYSLAFNIMPIGLVGVGDSTYYYN